MTLYEFNILDENTKCQTTWDLGKHIDTVFENKMRINLYAINRFFVEVYYDPTNNKIEGVYSFKSGYRLDKYAEDISLDNF